MFPPINPERKRDSYLTFDFAIAVFEGLLGYHFGAGASITAMPAAFNSAYLFTGFMP